MEANQHTLKLLAAIAVILDVSTIVNQRAHDVWEAPPPRLPRLALQPDVISLNAIMASMEWQSAVALLQSLPAQRLEVRCWEGTR